MNQAKQGSAFLSVSRPVGSGFHFSSDFCDTEQIQLQVFALRTSGARKSCATTQWIDIRVPISRSRSNAIRRLSLRLRYGTRIGRASALRRRPVAVRSRCCNQLGHSGERTPSDVSGSASGISTWRVLSHLKAVGICARAHSNAADPPIFWATSPSWRQRSSSRYAFSCQKKNSIPRLQLKRYRARQARRHGLPLVV